MNAPTIRLPKLDVLLVDDDCVNRGLAEGFLRGSGHRVESCDDGMAAVRAVAQAHFDVVLMAIRMPEMAGIDTALHIRAMTDRRKARIPILALIANFSPAEVDSCLGAGITDVIRTPIGAGSIDQALVPYFGLPVATRPEDRSPAAPTLGGPGEAGMPIIDGAHLALLAEAIEAPRLKELYAVARQSIDDSAAALRGHWQSGEAVAAGRDAHRLAGVAGNFGCVALAALARDIENACKAGGDGRQHEAQLQSILAASLAALSFDT